MYQALHVENMYPMICVFTVASFQLLIFVCVEVDGLCVIDNTNDFDKIETRFVSFLTHLQNTRSEMKCIKRFP